jgi:ABC-type uncharacterized transport system involved in gliding motility auxiliary subunit
MRSAAGRAGSVAAVLVVLALAFTAADRTRRTWDLTAERSLSLSPETKRVVDGLDRDVSVTAFIARDAPGRAEVAALLARYRRLDSQIEVRLVDPAEAPGELRRLGVDPAFQSLAVSDGERIERASVVSEQDVTAALARLVRGTDATVCFAAGHGEADPASMGSEAVSRAGQILADNGYRLDAVDLLRVDQVPGRCSALVVANPTAQLGAATGAITRYLAGGGSALVLADPASSVDLNGVVSDHGIELHKGLVLEGDPDLRLPTDPFTLAAIRYRSTSPVVRRLPPTLFPGAQAMTVDDRDRPGLSASPMVTTSSLAYLETEPTQSRFDPARDRAGPLTVAASADRSANINGRVVRSRLVVVGDVDWATNAFVGEAGNARLLVQAVDWLTVNEDLVSVSTNVARLRPLELTPARVRYLQLVSAGGVPAAFVLLGLVVWAWRRGR